MRRFITMAFALGLLFVLAATVAPAFAQTPAPGLFVANLTLNPAQPAFNQDISFVATFTNTTSTVQNFKWKVYIYKADAPAKSNNETTAQLTAFPVGSSDNPALGTYRFGATGFTCEYFFARVGWLNADNKITFFTAPDGTTVYEKGFQICDPSVIPTPTPAAAAPTATLTPPPPGVWVSDLVLNPAQPAFDQDISFTGVFTNTSNAAATFKWKVYIFKASAPAKSNSDTAAQTTEFPVGGSQVSALSTYSYGTTGFTCEYFFARVGWLDADNKITYFPAPDGSVFQKGFQICDKSVIPTPAPATPVATATPPPPAAGVFVTGIRFQPQDTPMHNQDTTMFVNFQNTSTSTMNFNWRVYIFKADTPAKSNTDTGVVSTAFTSGTQELQAANTFRYGTTGFSCDYFFARVGWLDSNNQINYFMSPNGAVFQKGFQVCN